MAHLHSTLNEQGFETYPKSPFKANVGAGLGERRGTWLDRREDTSAANLQRGWEGEMLMGAETLQNSSDEINSAWAESSELYFGS